MPDYKNTPDVTPAEALGKEGAAIALPQGCSMTGFFEEVDRLDYLFCEEKETLARLEGIVTSLESKQERQDQRGEAWEEDYTIKLIPFEAGHITWRKFLKRTVPYIAAFAAGALTYALLSDDDESITISSPEEVVMHYNRVVEAAGGQLIVPMPPGANTNEEVCWAAFGHLYGIVDPSPSPKENRMFVDSLIEMGLCTDVHTERGYYRFVPYQETPQPTER